MNTHPPAHTRPGAIVLPAWLPLVILAVALVLLFHRLLTGEALFWGLPSLQFYPWQEFALSELRAGRLPLWNPYNGAGAPLLANYQSAVFYPPNLLAILSSSPQAMGISAVGHLLWAGVGMWAFLGELGIRDFARGIGAISFALNTAVVARLGTLPMVDVAAWLPWLLLASEQLLTRRRMRALLLFAFTAAMLLLAGHAQWAFYSLILTGLYVLQRTWAMRWPVQRALWVGAALFLGIGLAAMQLLPTAELQRQSQRAGGVTEGFAFNFSYELALLPTMLQPDFYGNPGLGTYAINGAAFETAAYIGLLPALAALAALVQVLRRQARRLRRGRGITLALDDQERQTRGLIAFFGMVAGVTFLFALGRNFAPYVFLFRYVPTFSLFQAPDRWLLLTVFSLSMAAALGISLWRPDRYFLVRARLFLFAALILLVVGTVGAALRPAALTVGVRSLGFWLTLAAGLLLTWPGAARQVTRLRLWTLAALVFIALDLAIANQWSNPSVPTAFYDRPAGLVASGLSGPRTFRPDDAVEQMQFEEFLKFDDYRVAVDKQGAYRTSGLANLNLLDRVSSFNTFEPLRPAGVEAFAALLNAHPALNLYQAAAIGAPAAGSVSRAWVVPTAIGSADPLKVMADPAWDPYMSVLVDPEAPTFRGTARGTAQFVIDTPQVIQLAVTSSGPAALVLADTWYPGWVATINGTVAPIYRANGAFRAVMIPAGASEVKFRYAPLSVPIGVLVSAGAALLVVGLAIFGAARSARSPLRQRSTPQQ